MSEKEELIQLPDGSQRKKIEDMFFQMNYATGEWKRFIKYREIPVSWPSTWSPSFTCSISDYVSEVLYEYDSDCERYALVVVGWNEFVKWFMLTQLASLYTNWIKSEVVNVTR